MLGYIVSFVVEISLAVKFGSLAVLALLFYYSLPIKSFGLLLCAFVLLEGFCYLIVGHIILVKSLMLAGLTLIFISASCIALMTFWKIFKLIWLGMQSE